jgi:thymidylate synthase
MKTIAITACSINNVIGKGNTIPWYLPEDLKTFKRLTIGNGNNSIVMGRKTWDSLDRKVLQGRLNFVLTKNKQKFENKPNLIFVNDIEEVYIEHQKRKLDNMFVIGGYDIYKMFMEKNLVDQVYFTHVKKIIDGKDLIFFPQEYWLNFYMYSFEDCGEYDFIIYNKMKENSCETEYNNLVKEVIQTDDLCFFGNKMTFDLQKGFPLLTGKKMFFKGILEELLWFLSGKTNSKILKEKGVNIWEKNSTREYLDSVGLVKNKEHDLGPVYGHNFRHFGAHYKDCETNYEGQGVDQIQYVLDMIENNPSSRRILINLWNPCQLNEVALPPCHVLYQFKVDQKKNTLSCILYQRSGDVALGVPFNIASASLLTHIIAHLSKLKVGTLTHFIGDAHIYPEHQEGMSQQLNRYLFPLPKLKVIDRNQKHIEEFKSDDFVLQGYRFNPSISFPLIV